MRHVSWADCRVTSPLELAVVHVRAPSVEFTRTIVYVDAYLVQTDQRWRLIRVAFKQWQLFGYVMHVLEHTIGAAHDLARIITSAGLHVKCARVRLVVGLHDDWSRYVTLLWPWERRLLALHTTMENASYLQVWFGVLGGAYSALGRTHRRHAVEAGRLAVQQLRLARRMHDTTMECRCWIYIAESFIQIGQRDKAQQAIDHAEPLATLPTLRNMVQSAIVKLHVKPT